MQINKMKMLFNKCSTIYQLRYFFCKFDHLTTDILFWEEIDKKILTPQSTAPSLDPTSTKHLFSRLLSNEGRAVVKMNFNCTSDEEWDMKAMGD